MSGLNFESTGTAIEDLAPDGKMLKVYLVDTSEVTGKLGNKVPNVTVISGGGSKSRPVASTVVDYVNALWEGSDNGVNAPTIYKGEQVSVFKYANQDVYYWSKSRGFEPDVRGREARVKGVSTLDRTKEENLGKSADIDNMYYTRMDSINGITELITNKKNGEKAAYKVRLLGFDGIASLEDDLGNRVELRSEEGIFKVKANTKIELDAPTIHLKCKDYIVDTGTTRINSKTTVIKGNTFTGDISNSTFTGAMTIKGFTTGAGGVFKSAVTFKATGNVW